MTLKNIQAQTTQTGAFTGSNVDTSGISGDWTLKIDVNGLTAGASARFVIADNPGGGTAFVAGPSFHFFGQLSPNIDNQKSVKKAQWPSFVMGGAGNLLQVQLVYLTPGASVSYRVSAEY